MFWFKSRNLDNFLRSFLICIPIWTLVEVLVLWCYGNGIHAFGWVDWQDNWLWLVVLTLLVPAIHEIHFFCIHRLIHTPFLYKHIHSVHHNSINPSPRSSLSMHWIEHTLYFGEILWHLLIPSNPIVMMFNSYAVGHARSTGTSALTSWKSPTKPRSIAMPTPITCTTSISRLTMAPTGWSRWISGWAIGTTAPRRPTKG
ncbi:sterol desaturase family protein [Mameliella sp.]|uniref:sterol desaturase family protein n=1 Tax=Mameliella sp. TaxID=1924940 RepID=UPI003BA9C3EC